jgi:hypothetical protein
MLSFSLPRRCPLCWWRETSNGTAPAAGINLLRPRGKQTSEAFGLTVLSDNTEGLTVSLPGSSIGIAQGWLLPHESYTYVKFTDSGFTLAMIGRRLQPRNSTKAAICVTKTAMTIAKPRYTSLRENGSSNFIGQPPFVAGRIIFGSKILS